MEALFEELRAREEPVELILAGDFFDFLTIGEVPKDRTERRLRCRGRNTSGSLPH